MDNRAIIADLRNKIAEIGKYVDWMEKSGQIHPIDFDLILNKTRELYDLAISHVIEQKSPEAPAPEIPLQIPPPIQMKPAPEPVTVPVPEPVPEPPAFFQPRRELIISEPIESPEFPIEDPVAPISKPDPRPEPIPEPAPRMEIPKPEPPKPEPPRIQKVYKPEQPINSLLFQREDSINDLLGKQKPSQDLASALTETPVADIWSAIAINDRFLFTRELFGNDSESFKTTVSLLNSISSWEAARKYISDHFSWDNENAVVKDFLTIVRRRFL